MPAESPAPYGVWTPGDPAVNADARWLSHAELLIPVRGISRESLKDSFHAGRSGGRVHAAVDILAKRGTPVLAATDGTILRIGTNELGGNVVWMTDTVRLFAYYYAHLDRHARGIRVGDHVRRGDVIGYVGTTGNAPENVPHLHFQVMRTPDPEHWWNGTPVDPVPYLTAGGAVTTARREGEP